MIYSLATVGVPGAVGLIWMLGADGGLLFQLFLVFAAFLGATLWGILMWEFFVKGFLHSPGDETKGRKSGITE